MAPNLEKTFHKFTFYSQTSNNTFNFFFYQVKDESFAKSLWDDRVLQCLAQAGITFVSSSHKHSNNSVFIFQSKREKSFKLIHITSLLVNSHIFVNHHLNIFVDNDSCFFSSGKSTAISLSFSEEVTNEQEGHPIDTRNTKVLQLRYGPFRNK